MDNERIGEPISARREAEAILGAEDRKLSLADVGRLALDAAARDFAPAPSSCRAGCGACCRQLVTVSPAEAFRIAEVVGAMEEPRRSEVSVRFDSAVRALTVAGLAGRLDELADPACPPERHHAIARDYFALQLPCPFLADESCSIHPDRPLICREYHVASSPAECARPFDGGVRVIPPPTRHDEALKLLTARLTHDEVRPVPLVMALEFAAVNPTVRSQSVDASKAETLSREYREICTDSPLQTP